LTTKISTILCAPRLESQSDKDYARSKYNNRIRNNKS